MRRENELRVRKLAKGGPDPVRHGLNEFWTIEEWLNFVDLGRAFSRLRPCARNIFQILPAAGIGCECGGGKSHGAPDSVSAHLAHGIGEHRMPVAVAPIHRYSHAFPK